MRNRRGLLQLEGLTERIVPAVSIRSVDGDLVIRGTPNQASGVPTLLINVTFDNTVSITDGSVNRGTYSVDGDLILTLSNRNDNVTITLSGGDLSGSIVANLLNGNDNLTVTTSGAARTISGGISMDGGNGTDILTVRNGNSGDFEIGGGISFNGGSGQDTFSLNPTGSAGDLISSNTITLTRVNTVGIADAGNKNVTVSGSVIINASTDKLIPTNVTIGDSGTNVSLAGLLNITGTDANDSVTLENVGMVNTVPTSEDDTELYEISINLGKSSITGTGNVLNITDVQFGDSNSKADFVYTGGKGKDDINITGISNFTGNARFTLGDGVNDFTVTDSTGGVEFEGDITIIGGKNADTLAFDKSIVSGLLTANLGSTLVGNGDNSLSSSGEIAGGFTYTGGSGADNITLDNCEDLAGPVNISLGAGTTRCTFSNTNGSTKMDSFTVDLGTSTNNPTGGLGIAYASELASLIVFLNPGVVTTTSDPTLN